jgi:hypothetical protein
VQLVQRLLLNRAESVASNSRRRMSGVSQAPTG